MKIFAVIFTIKRDILIKKDDRKMKRFSNAGMSLITARINWGIKAKKAKPLAFLPLNWIPANLNEDLLGFLKL